MIIKLIFIISLIFINSFALNLQRPKIYKSSIDTKTWLISEKLDGIRGYYDGKILETRKGKILHAPKWFLKGFPSFKLDGELWTKRHDFETIQSIVMDKHPSEDWNKITYNIFEVPDAKGDFYQRLNKLRTWLKLHPNKYIRIIPQKPFISKANLAKFLKA